MPTLTRNLFYGSGEGRFALEVEGDWPTDLDGYVFNVGPDRKVPGGHWFAGQGLLMRVACRPDASGRIGVDLRRIETPLERIRRHLPHLFSRRGVQEVSPFGFTNFANTNVQAMGGRLFIGYDVGRPIEVDPESLETLTPVGRNAEWLQTLPAAVEPMIAVAAHPGPGWDEGALYFANYEMIPLSPVRELRVCRWELEGPVVHWPLEGVGHFDSIHDVKVTRNYVVITDLPFVVDPFDAGGTRRAVADTTQVWIVRKADLESTPPGTPVPHRFLRIPMMSGHMAVDYDDEGDRIVLYLVHHPLMDLTLAIEPGDRCHRTGAEIHPDYEGLIPMGGQPNGIGRHVVDARNGTLLESHVVADPERFWGGALFTQNLSNDESRARARNVWLSSVGHDPALVSERWWRVYAEHHENLFVPPRDFPEDGIPPALARIDLERMEMVDLHAYASGAFPHPPTFVPRSSPNHDADGYIVVPVHKDGDKEIHVFDASDLAAGPVATAHAPGFNPPLLLHSWWMARRPGPRPSSYCVDAEADAWETLQAFAENPGASVGIGRALYGQGE